MTDSGWIGTIQSVRYRQSIYYCSVHITLFNGNVCVKKRDLEPAHDEHELEESKHGEVEITLVFVKGLTSEQATAEECVDGYRHNLQYIYMLSFLFHTVLLLFAKLR